MSRRVVPLRGVTVSVDDNAPVNPADCRFCTMDPPAAVSLMRRLAAELVGFTICNPCGEGMSAEIVRQLKQRRAS